ncbi:MAG: damage-inducible protein DinB [Cellulophaga sp.]|nr:damage-inducible protein DinB [Cellulophaga sp.]
MKNLFNELFDYNFYCNKKLIEQFESTLDKVQGKNISLFSHILNAHHIWNARLTASTEKFQVFQLHSIKEFADIHYDNQRTSFEIITNINDFEKRIDYENSEGRQFANTAKDILFHMINHATYHRGQIATESRNNNIEPLALDYIIYKR